MSIPRCQWHNVCDEAPALLPDDLEIAITLTPATSTPHTRNGNREVLHLPYSLT